MPLETVFTSITLDPRNLYLHSVGQRRGLDGWWATIWGRGNSSLNGNGFGTSPEEAIGFALADVKDITTRVPERMREISW